MCNFFKWIKENFFIHFFFVKKNYLSYKFFLYFFYFDKKKMPGLVFCKSGKWNLTLSFALHILHIVYVYNVWTFDKRISFFGEPFKNWCIFTTLSLDVTYIPALLFEFWDKRGFSIWFKFNLHHFYIPSWNAALHSKNFRQKVRIFFWLFFYHSNFYLYILFSIKKENKFLISIFFWILKSLLNVKFIL